MEQDFFLDEQIAHLYDASSQDMYAPELLGATVDLFAALAGGGSRTALELGVGTGRVAIPLAERSVRVSGIDLSEPMLDELRRLAPGDRFRTFDVTPTHLGFDEYEVADQRCTSHHVLLDGDRVAARGASHHRYLWPSELDLMAASAASNATRAGPRRRGTGSPARAATASRSSASRECRS